MRCKACNWIIWKVDENATLCFSCSKFEYYRLSFPSKNIPPRPKHPDDDPDVGDYENFEIEGEIFDYITFEFSSQDDFT